MSDQPFVFEWNSFVFEDDCPPGLMDLPLSDPTGEVYSAYLREMGSSIMFEELEQYCEQWEAWEGKTPHEWMCFVLWMARNDIENNGEFIYGC